MGLQFDNVLIRCNVSYKEGTVQYTCVYSICTTVVGGVCRRLEILLAAHTINVTMPENPWVEEIGKGGGL